MDKIKTPNLRFRGYTEEWEEKKLGEIAEIISGGGTPKTSNISYWNGNIPWIQSSDLSKDSVSKIEINKYINEDALNNSSAKLIEQNSIAIVSRVGVGKVVKVPFDYATSQDFLSLSKIDGNIDFWTYTIKNLMRIESHYLQGTSIKGITKDEILNIHCYSPSLSEQEKIGSFLSKIDERIELEEKKLSLLKERKRGWMQKLFNQEIRFKDENGSDYPDWEEKRLGEVSRPKQWKTINSDQLLDAGFPVYGANGIIGYYSEYNHEKEAVCVTCRGATCGNVHFTQEKSYITGNAMVLESLSQNLKYTYYYLLYRGLNDVITGSAQPQITGELLKVVKIPFPSLPEQQKIADFLSKQDELISAQEEKVSLLKEQKKGLLQQMFV